MQDAETETISGHSIPGPKHKQTHWLSVISISLLYRNVFLHSCSSVFSFHDCLLPTSMMLREILIACYDDLLSPDFGFVCEGCDQMGCRTPYHNGLSGIAWWVVPHPDTVGSFPGRHGRRNWIVLSHLASDLG